MDKLYCSKNIQFSSESEFKRLGHLGFAKIISETISESLASYDVLTVLFNDDEYIFKTNCHGVYIGNIKGTPCEARTLFKKIRDRYTTINYIALFKIKEGENE